MSVLKKYWGVLRRVRLLHYLNNVVSYRFLVKNKELYKRSGLNKSVFASLSHSDFKKSVLQAPWLDEPNAVEKMKLDPRFKQFSPEIQEQLLLWPSRGYILLRGFVKPQVCEQISTDLEQHIQKKNIDFDYTNSRVMNLYKKSPTVNDVINDSRIINLLSFIFNKPALPFQTINFIYGSQQNSHSDSIHMTTEPLGYLAAIWLALENHQPGCGLLHYYPGSHRLPYIMSEDFDNGNTRWTVGEDYYGNYERAVAKAIETNKLQKEVFDSKQGDLFIWHANLLHGGEKRTNPTATRKSLVAHYFCDGDVVNYHEITQRVAIVKK